MNTTNISTTFGRGIATSSALFKKTLLLLGSSLLFSAVTAYYAYISNARPVGIIVFLIGAFGLPMLTQRLRHSRWGLLAVFVLTGFFGYVLGPIINMYMHSVANGAQLVSTALGATAFIFFSLSAFALVSKKNFSYMGGSLFILSMVAFMGGIGAMIFHLPMLQLVVSGVFALVSSGYILFTLSNIVHGQEDSAISATVILFLSLFNLFLSLLNILSFLSGGRR